MPPRRGLRFASDLGLTVIISSWAAVLMTLAAGRPGELLNELVCSVCIGIVALLIVDGLRLAFRHDPLLQRHGRIPFLVLLVPVAPLAHYTGLRIGGLLLGLDTPDLAQYLTVPRISMILFTLLAIFALLGLILSRERMDRIKLERSEAHARAETVERQALQAQLRLLQAQIEPHMLFNTLANLQGLIAIDPQRAGQMLDQLIQYLRATLNVSRAETTTLDQEFAALDAYLGLMSVRMGARLAYRCALPDALRAARLPTMLLQPLVENAVVHGLEPKVDGGTVTIEAVQRGELLEISVRDTGLGQEQASPRHGGGVGLATTRERLQVLYGERAGVDLLPCAPQGTLARLTLPLELP
jgi:signal transduction histidine kinase